MSKRMPIDDGFKRKYCNVTASQLAKNDRLWQSIVEMRKKQKEHNASVRYDRLYTGDKWNALAQNMANEE